MPSSSSLDFASSGSSAWACRAAILTGRNARRTDSSVAPGTKTSIRLIGKNMWSASSCSRIARIRPARSPTTASSISTRSPPTLTARPPATRAPGQNNRCRAGHSAQALPAGHKLRARGFVKALRQRRRLALIHQARQFAVVKIILARHNAHLQDHRQQAEGDNCGGDDFLYNDLQMSRLFCCAPPGHLRQ